MKNNKHFEISDGWLFATLLCNGTLRHMRLDYIVSTGNMLNHAIFSLDEINDGLSRLESEGYVEVKKGRCIFTEKAKLFKKNNKKRFRGCIEEQVHYSNVFSKMPLIKGTIYKEYFSEKEYSKCMEKCN